MVLAFNIDTFTENSETFSAMCLLFIFYGFNIVPFTYLFGFTLKNMVQPKLQTSLFILFLEVLSHWYFGL